MALEPGTPLGSFEISRMLGVGGMGEVYLAKDTTLGRDVAIKVMAEDFAEDPARQARFAREAKMPAALAPADSDWKTAVQALEWLGRGAVRYACNEP